MRRAVLLLVVWLAACAAPGPYVAHEASPPPRDRYLPLADVAPASAVPSEAERRALEAEWPPVHALSLPPPPPPDGPIPVRAPALGRPRPPAPGLARAVVPFEPAVHGAPAASSVIVRTLREPGGARVVLILEAR